MKRKRIGISLVLIMIAVAVLCIGYVNIYYHAEDTALESLQSTTDVEVTKINEGYFFDGSGTKDALIFYPGAKVEDTAYAPLMHQLAEQGVDCFLLKMPCNLAFLGKDKADDVLAEYEYENWYLAGHSLGGAMAAVYASEQQEKLAGLILLAAYPTKPLEDEVLKLLSIYGSEDGVLNMEKVKDGKQYYPTDYEEVCIQGGNHAYYGNYGEQKGDGTALISREDQQKQTVDAIVTFLGIESPNPENNHTEILSEAEEQSEQSHSQADTESKIADASENTGLDTLENTEADGAENDQQTQMDQEFYATDLTDDMKLRITGISYPAEAQSDISYEDLAYVHVLHYDFNHEVQEGELICNQTIAQDLVEIFQELYEQQYLIEKIKLIDEYRGDDEASMEDNNTSCFNYRTMASGSKLSNHSYGTAIDINPLYNPYVKVKGDGSSLIQPVIAGNYVDRTSGAAYMITPEDLCYQLFTEHGFTWGGDWNNPKDYQHFEKV